MKQFEARDLKDKLENIGNSTNALIEESNTNTTRLYNLLSNTTKSVSTITKKIAVLGDMITDLSIINGKSKSRISLSDLDIYSQKGIELKDGTVYLAKTNETLMEYSLNSTILSTKPYIIRGLDGKTKTIEDFYKYKTETILEVTSVGYDFNFVLDFQKLTKINQIKINLPLTAKSYPTINNITTVNNGVEIPVKILNNNSFVYSFDDNRVIGNEYIIDIEPIDTKELRFNLFSKVDTSVTILSISTSYNKYVESGSIIFGPIVSETPILKIGVNSTESSDNVGIQISTDLEQWIDIVDSFKVSLDKVRKVVAYNTINELSFKTTEPVNSIYLRLNLNAVPIDVVSTNSEYESYREDLVVSDSIFSKAESNRISAFKIKNNDLVYGENTYKTNLDISEDIRSNSESITINGFRKILGFVSSPYCIGVNDNSFMNVDVKFKSKRLPASIDIDATKFDSVSSQLYDINVIPINGTINTLTENNIVVKLTNKEDDYKLIVKSTKEFINIKINSSYIESGCEALYEVPYDDILLKDSLGNTLIEISKENLLKIETNDTANYFVSLIGVLYTLPTVGGYTPNLLYPLRNLDETEYSVINGKIILGKGSIENISGYQVIKTKINKKLSVSYQNGNTWERIDPLYTYYNEQIDKRGIETSVIKLDHRSIEKGSLNIFEYNAYESVGSDSTGYIAVSNQYLKDKTYIASEKNPDQYLEE